MINRYISPEEQLRQINEAKKGKWLATHGANFDIKPALAAYDDYIKNHKKAGNLNKLAKKIEAWCKGVGGELRKYPAWLVQEYCRADKTMDRTDADIKNETQMNRTPGMDDNEVRGLYWWFKKTYQGGLLGDKWCAYRGWNRVQNIYAKISTEASTDLVAYDCKTAQKLTKRNFDELEQQANVLQS